jgi:hypothetical protein
MRLGPEHGELLVHTHRDGVAAKAGHDLVLRVTRWEAQLEPGGDVRVELTAEPASIEVVEGHGGARPLSERDRRDIVKNIAGKVLGSRPVSFRSERAEELGSGRYAVEGPLTVAGRTQTVSWELELGEDGRVAGEAVVVQSRFGIKPYSALLGALRVGDRVEVRFSGTAAC